MKNTTEILSRFVVQTTYEDLPDQIIHEVKRNLLDTIGCTLGGLECDIGFEALSLARTLGGRPESTIIGTGEKTSCTLAAYVNARIANALDADETLPIPVHFGNAIMGAGLALGERNGSSGKELVAAYAVAYELASRIAIGMRPPGFNPSLFTPAVLIVFAALGAASKLLCLNEDQVRHAMGIAVAACPISVMGKWTESTILPTLKYADSGWCAQIGVTASLMAQIGTSAFDTILDDKRHFWSAYGTEDVDFERMSRGLGQDWHILDTAYKPWPGNRYTHYPLWLFLKIKEENHLSPEEIRKVVIRMGPTGTSPRFVNQEPKGPITCEFNHPHAIAMGALGMEPGPKWYAPQTMEDQRVIEFRKRVEVRQDPGLAKADLPEGRLRWKFPTILEVSTASGKRFRASTEYTKGDPWTEETYFTDQELKRKFLLFASSAFSGSERGYEQMERTVNLVFDAEGLFNVTQLTDSLAP